MVWGKGCGEDIVRTSGFPTLCTCPLPPLQVESLRTMYTRKVRDLEARLKVGAQT